MDALRRFVSVLVLCLPLSVLALDCNTEIQRKKSTIDWAELQEWQVQEVQELLAQAKEAEVARDPLRCQKVLSRIDELLREDTP